MDSTVKVIEFVTPKNKYTIFYYKIPASFGSPYIYIKVANLILRRVASVCFPDIDLLWIETCSSILCDIIKISKEQYCTLFVLLNFSNWLVTMHGMDNIRLKYNRNYINQRLCIQISLNRHFVNTTGNSKICSVYCFKCLPLNTFLATQYYEFYSLWFMLLTHSARMYHMFSLKMTL